MTDITVKNVDVIALRDQRNALLTTIEDIEGLQLRHAAFVKLQIERLDGIVNLLDAMLDNAEGFGD